MTPPTSADDAHDAPRREAREGERDRPELVLQRPLGVGRTSRVWRGRLTDRWDTAASGTSVAVKVLRQDLVQDDDALATLRNEAEVSRAVHHPGLARTRYDELDGITPPLADDADREALGDAARDASAKRPWLLLDLVPGPSLDEARRTETAMPEPVVRAIGARLARAIGAMHAAGWVHGDVKPENIRLDAEGRAVLVDLGFAGRAGAPNAPLGTPTYLAPERARGGPPAASADLFALGCVLYEIVVGAPAAGDPPDLELLRSGGVRPPSDLVPRVSPLLDALVLALLAPNPAARPTATEIVQALENGEASEWWRARLRSDPEAGRPTVAWSGRHGLPLVGRDAEMEALGRSWERARTSGAAVVLTGERGTGKSRLVAEFAHRVRHGSDEPPTYLYGRCDAVGDDRPGAPLIALLRRWLHLPPEARPGPRARRLIEASVPPDVARTLIGMLEPESEDASSAEVSEAVALGEWLLALGREAPAIVFLDDVNFAGTATLTALRRVARELPERRLLLVIGLRQRAPVRHVAALSELRARLSDVTDRIDLGPLDEDAVLALVERLFHHSVPRLRLARTLHARTEGVPGSLGELLRLAAERGWTRPVPAPGRGLALLVEPDALPRPESMRVAVEERLRALDGRLRVWLERLAVVGGRIDPALVAAAWPRSRARDRDAVFAQLVQSDWLVPAGSRYRFTEPVEREETLAQASERRLRRAHAAVARALAETEEAEGVAPTYRRAFHLREAGAHEELLAIVHDLSERLRNGDHPHRRAKVAGWGLEALSATPPGPDDAALRRSLLEALADAADRLGEREDQRAALDELGDLDIDVDEEPAAAAHVYLLHARHAAADGQLGLARGFLRNARELGERAAGHRSTERKRLAADRAEVERLAGELAIEVGDYGRASEHASRAHALAPDAVARALARNIEAEVEIHEGRVGSALRKLAAARRNLRRSGGGLAARAARAATSLLGGRAWRMASGRGWESVWERAGEGEGEGERERERDKKKDKRVAERGIGSRREAQREAENYTERGRETERERERERERLSSKYMTRRWSVWQ
ncbi:MAG: AAA family ATPase [Planctomycetota bacterium]